MKKYQEVRAKQLFLKLSRKKKGKRKEIASLCSSTISEFLFFLFKSMPKLFFIYLIRLK